MNPVFWFLVFLAAVVLWLAISFIFIPLGGLLRSISMCCEMCRKDPGRIRSGCV